jgi:hypothetical protein
MKQIASVSLMCLLYLVLSTTAFTQKAKKSSAKSATDPAATATPLEPATKKTTPAAKPVQDSAEFVKTFKEFYPLVKPKQSIREMADQYYARVSRGFAKLELDSAETYKMAMKNLDTSADERIFFDNYRKNLSAKELKAYLAFLKTPEGKKVIEVMPMLQRSSSETNGYVSKTINTNIAPLRQKQSEMMRKEVAPQDSIKGPDGKMMARPNPAMDPERMKMRDSLMKVRQEEMMKQGGGK